MAVRSSTGTRPAADEIGRAVRSWLDGLDNDQRVRASFRFDDPERFVWAYTPGTREGLPIGAMRPEQRAAASAIVAASLSVRGATEVSSVMALERALGELERKAGRAGWQRRDPELYWFAVFGDPDDRTPWSWRIGGHHVAISITIAGHLVVGSAPSFLGANPATVTSGSDAGFRAIDGEEVLARRLLVGLSPAQRRLAIVDDVPPADILSGNGARAIVGAIPTGISHEELDGTQRASLEGLIRHYLGRACPEVEAAEWDRIVSAGLPAVTFAWAGSEMPGQGHYYAIRGPGFLVEYDNTQDEANHIHAVWRDLDNDWGTDLLADHYANWHTSDR